MAKSAINRMRVASVAVLGAITIAVLLWIGVSSPGASCGNQSGAPATAFQFASSASNLDDIFGADGSKCRDMLVSGLRFVTQADLFLFVPLYALFLACFAAMIASWTKVPTTLLAAALVTTIAGDVLETATQLMILNEIDDGAQLLVNLSIGNMLKIFGLALVLLVISHALWNQGRMSARFTATLLGLCAIIRGAAFAIEPMRSLAPLTALFAYILMLAYAIGCYSQLRHRPANRGI